MTVVVAFLCKDGVVIGADSMLTPSMGNINVGHHKGVKVHELAGTQLFAFAGDQGQAARFQIMANGSHAQIAHSAHAIDYPIILTTALLRQFQQTGISQPAVNSVLGFMHAGAQTLCVFEGAIQPRLLDENHYYVALGSGKLSADPFLRFLADIFCVSGPPTVQEACLLTTWAIQHVIDTNPGGVSGPIKIGTLTKDAKGIWYTQLLSDDQIDDHKQSVESALDQLRSWRDDLGRAAGEDAGVPTPPMPSTSP